MTQQEAIQILEVAKAECEWSAPLDYQEAFNMAIEALNKQVPDKPDENPCKLDDAIIREQARANLLEDSARGCDMNDKTESEIARRSSEAAEEHRQLAEWLKELKGYRNE